MDKKQALRVLKEIERRHLKGKPDWEGQCFPKQWEFITSKAPLKALQCTRRAGKSYSAGIYAMKEAYETPGVNIVIIGLTRDSVKRIFYKDILKAIDKQFNLRGRFNGSDLTVTLPNGSIIYLIGVDANPDDMNKLLGQKNKLAIIDEAAFFRQDMNKLVFEILKPSLADYQGTLAMTSTTSNLTNSLYFDVTNEKAKGWELFKWTAYDNPYMAEQWKKEITFLKHHNPTIEETPHFRRMYMNLWYVDVDALVYKHANVVTISSLPGGHRWNYLLGIDLGYNDPSAFVVCAYSPTDPTLYVLETFKQSEMIVGDVGVKIKELDARYNFDTMVIDGASKQAVEELKKRFQLPLIIAEKTTKRDYIELLNSDMILGNIKILPPAKGLETEWAELIWDDKALAKGKYVEHASCANHLTDSFLYAWRWAFNYSSKKPGLQPKVGSVEEVDTWWDNQGDVLELDKYREDVEEEDLYG